MPDYRRATVPGGTYFFTLVTYRRRAVLCDDPVRSALRDAIVETRAMHPFVIDAWVLLPDHLHCIWTLPSGDAGYALRWSMIKRLVTQRLRGSVFGAHNAPYGTDAGCAVRTTPSAHKRRRDEDVGCAMRTTPSSRIRRREGHLWQRRFWEHLVRDQDDLNRCRDYLHWNPVRHGHATRVADWPYSSFHRFVGQGRYPVDWGGHGIDDGGPFGE